MAIKEKPQGLHRGLEARHIELIALGGTIGVGINPDTRISLLVRMVFLAAVSLCYFVFGMHKVHHEPEKRI